MNRNTTCGPRPKRFRELLRSELGARCASNPQYSLRAFGRALDFDHSTLSKILRGQRRLTAATIRELGAGLGLDQQAIEDHVVLERSAPRAGAKERHVEQLRADAEQVIAGWHHYAILELTRIESFQADSQWIARVLDISVDTVNIAIQRLLHLRLLRMVGESDWRVGPDLEASLDRLPSAVVRSLHAQLAERSTASLAGGDDRLFSSTTFAASRRGARLALEVLRRLSDETTPIAQRDTPDEVYQLQISFFPLTRAADTLAPRKGDPNGTSRNEVPDRRQRS